MPELPEVESVRRKLEKALRGRRIAAAEFFEAPLVLSGIPAGALREVVEGATVEEVGRKGKYLWLELEDRPALMGHLGMSGWIRALNARPGPRLIAHGEAPLDDADGSPRFAKLILRTDSGRRFVFTDPRRFGRLWLAGDPTQDPRILALGPDAWLDLPAPDALHELFLRRNAPIKGLLLDQKLFAGIGNWIADEALYHAGIRPSRPAASLSQTESAALRRSIQEILDTAVGVNANKRRFPKTWLFHHRWSRGKRIPAIGGKPIIRETIAGRTTAWVPELQR